MSKYLILFAILASPHAAVSHAKPGSPLDVIKYKAFQASQDAKAPQTAKLKAFLKTEGFLSMKVDGTFPGSVFMMDEVFASPDLSSAVFVKYGLEPTDAKLLQRQLSDGSDGVLYHGRNSAGLFYAIYLLSLESKELPGILGGMESALSSVKPPETASKGSRFSFISEAHAESPECSPSSGTSNSVSKLANQVLPNQDDATVLSLAWPCAKGIFRGAWQGTGRLAASIFSGEMWRSVKYGWNSIKALYNDFEKTISTAYSEITSLPIETRAKLFCELVGIGVANLGITFATGGAGAPITITIGTNWDTKALAALETSSQYSKILKAMKSLPSCESVSNKKDAAKPAGPSPVEPIHKDPANAQGAQ